MTLASPCIRNCCLDDQDICVGCRRSLEEILQWGGADDQHKRQILERVAARKQALRISSLAAKQERFNTSKDNLGSHGRQNKAGDFAEDV